MFKPDSFRPLAHRVLLELENADERSQGGIIIPEDARKFEIGKVLAAGPGHMLDSGSYFALGVKPGDRVLFKADVVSNAARFGDRKQFAVVTEPELLGVIVEPR